ncbi:hypothetical protein L208DRAFT_1377220 [Tricholoma matsutake]|nr:hypothetical protein L208DRAFT_1377220 [Tricholoma matsutake 945]
MGWKVSRLAKSAWGKNEMEEEQLKSVQMMWLAMRALMGSDRREQNGANVMGHRICQTGAIFSWAFETVKGKLCQELVALADSDNRLHFNASKTLLDYLKGSFMQIAAQKIKHSAPYLWDLVYSMLDANPSCRRAMVHNLNDAEIMEGLAAVEEGDLGEIGGNDEMDMMEDNENIEDADKPEVKAKKRNIKAALWNAALLVINSVVSISIFAQSTNEQCNYLQSVLGIFFHSTAVPEKVIETLAHAGLSISQSSIHNAVKSLSQEAGQKIQAAV